MGKKSVKDGVWAENTKQGKVQKPSKIRFSVIAPAIKTMVIIFFAVLLTTCAIASTFAKFTTKINSSAGVKAAGFLINGFNKEEISQNVLIAPGDNKAFNISFNYYSQVDTEFLDGGAPKISFTGAWESFGVLIEKYNEYCEIMGYEPNAPASLEECFEVRFGDGETSFYIAVVKALIAKGAQTEAVGDLEPIGEYFTAVTAMDSGATATVPVEIPVSLTWIDTGNNTWDTFLGEEVAKYEGGLTQVQVNFDFVAQQIVGDITQPPVTVYIDGVARRSYLTGATVEDILNNGLFGVTAENSIGWHTDEECTQPAPLNMVVTSGTPLYTKMSTL